MTAPPLPPEVEEALRAYVQTAVDDAADISIEAERRSEARYLALAVAFGRFVEEIRAVPGNAAAHREQRALASAIVALMGCIVVVPLGPVHRRLNEIRDALIEAGGSR